MMTQKILLLLTMGCVVFCRAEAQQFMTREGQVHFFSSTPLEDIEADNGQMSAILDEATGGFAFQVQMRAFHFPKALMEEHFNESYVESDAFPKATFRGTLEAWDPSTEAQGPMAVVAQGEFDFHGVKATRSIPGEIMRKDGNWVLDARFTVALKEHDIRVPAVVRDNIAATIAVDVHAELAPR